MATIKSYTDLEQSKKLTEILPIESADMIYHSVENEYGSEVFVATSKVLTNGFNNDDFYIDDIPCWSLAALLDVLPEIQGGKPIIALDDNYITYPHMSDLHTKAGNLVDACYEVIIKLYELKML